MTYYQKHIFFCTNQRLSEKPCCAMGNAAAMCAHAKETLKNMGLTGPGKVRVSHSGCMGRCSEGPVMVIYPQARWYTYTCQADIDEILRAEILENRQVNRLLLSSAFPP